MSELVRHLRNSGAIEPSQLDAAFRRQQIYGGSLDTVLLELELLTPTRMDELLALACGLPPVPVALLAEPRDRRWQAVPKELVDLGWVMPLGDVDGRLHVAVHPELSDDKLAQLRREAPGAVAMVTAECCLAKLASERTGSVIPQRYAVLAMGYIDTMRAAAEPAAPEESAAPAPWMSSPALERPLTVPPPTEAPAPAPDPAPNPDVTPDTETTQQVPTFPPPPRQEDSPAGREPERTQAYFQPPPVRNPNVAAAPLPEPPPYQAGGRKPVTETNLPRYTEPEPTPDPGPSTDHSMVGSATLNTEGQTSMVGSETVVAELPTLQGSASHSAEPIAEALQEQFAIAKAEIESARERDGVTDALLRAAMLITPRVALFGVKKEGLRGLHGPGAIPGIEGAVIPASQVLANALSSGPLRERVSDLDLRLAVEQESPIPCLLAPVKVRRRAVLLLYLDRSGRDFSEADVSRAGELCDAASRSLEEVLKLLAGQKQPVSRGGAAAQSSTGAPAAKPESRVATRPPLFERMDAPQEPRTITAMPEGSMPPPGRAGRVEMPDLIDRDTKPKLPRLVDTAPPHRFNTLVGTGPGMAGFAEAAGEGGKATTQPPTGQQPGPPPGDGDSNSRTLPGIELSPLTRPAIEAPIDDAARPAKHMLTLTAAPPPPAPPPVPDFAGPQTETTGTGIQPLSTPLVQGTSRGQLVFEDEESTEVKQPAPADSVEARIDACLQSAMGGGASVADLMGFGEKALIRIASRFPGPIDVFRRDLDSLPPPSAHGPLVRLVIQIGDAIVPHLIELMDHRSPNVRFYAAFVFQALRDDRCIAALAEHAFDADSDVRAISMRVLETYSRSGAYAAALVRVRTELESANRTRQLHAARALGTLRDVNAVGQLIELLSNPDRYIQEASLESLCSVTGQQFGLKPHRWRKWFTENGARHRVEWIMSSLNHRDVSVRRWAADELRRVTGQDIDFPASGEQSLRDAALRRWMEWWHNQGRAQFGWH